MPQEIKRNDYWELCRKLLAEGKRLPKDDEYEFIPLDLSAYHLSETTKRIANANFTYEDVNRNGDYMLTGNWFNRDLIYQFAKRCEFDLEVVDGYSAYAYSDEQMAVFTYCEGDIYLTPFTDREKYEKEKADTIKFYKEAY